MKSIEIDDDLYTFIASQTKHIGESASDILRRLLMEEAESTPPLVTEQKTTTHVTEPSSTESDTAEVKPTSVKSESPEETVKAESPAVKNSDDILERITDRALSEYAKRVDQFLYILSVAYELNTQHFGSVESIKGKNRVYFAQSKEKLLETGSSTNPKQIPNSEFWVVTNNNTAKKVTMLKQVLDTLGYSEDIINAIVKKFS